MAFRALPGGTVVAITATPQNVDMTMFIGMAVSIGSQTQEVLVCATNNPTDTTLTTTPVAADLTNKTPDFIRADTETIRVVDRRFPYWTIATATGSANVFIKPVAYAGESFDGR